MSPLCPGPTVPAPPPTDSLGPGAESTPNVPGGTRVHGPLVFCMAAGGLCPPPPSLGKARETAPNPRTGALSSLLSSSEELTTLNIHHFTGAQGYL